MDTVEAVFTAYLTQRKKKDKLRGEKVAWVG